MSRYWVRNEEGLVLGPVSVAVLRDLIAAGKLAHVRGISTDGRSFEHPSRFPEVAALFQPAEASAGEAERREASRLLQRVEAMKGQPTYVLFGVAPDAGLEAHRASFFRLVKKYHPERLPAKAHPDLRAAYAKAFGLLSERMRAFEAAAGPAAARRRAEAAARTEGGLSSARAASGSAAGQERAGPGGRRERSPEAGAAARGRRDAEEIRRSPTYAAVEFIGLERRGNRRVEVRIPVTVKNAGMFSEHNLVNLSSGGFFVEADKVLPTGLSINVMLRFKEEDRDVPLQGKVVWENAQARPGQPVGFGVKITEIDEDDLDFVREFVSRAGEDD